MKCCSDLNKSHQSFNLDHFIECLSNQRALSSHTFCLNQFPHFILVESSTDMDTADILEANSAEVEGCKQIEALDYSALSRDWTDF